MLLDDRRDASDSRKSETRRKKNGNREITRNDTVIMRCDEDYPSSAGFRVINSCMCDLAGRHSGAALSK
jgi:hypothetical protein